MSKAQSQLYSCSQSQQSTVHQRADKMASTAFPGPLRIFQEVPSLTAPTTTSPVQFYGSTELTFTNQSKNVRVKKRRFSPPDSLPPPPQPIVMQDAEFSSMQVAPFSRSLDDSDSLRSLGMIISPHLHPVTSKVKTTACIQTVNDISPAAPNLASEERDVAVHRLDTGLETMEGCWSPLMAENPEHTDTTAGATKWSIAAPQPEHSMKEAGESDINGDSDSGWQTQPLHQPLTRQGPSSSVCNRVNEEHLSPNVYTLNHSPAVLNGDSADTQGELLLISPDSDTPLLLGKTKPVPPPRTPPSELERESEPLNQSSSQNHEQSSPKCHRSKTLHSSVSSPPILTDSSPPPRRLRLVSFLQCKAGEDQGQFRADYLGSKEVDGYINVVNSVAKQLVDQRPAEVVAYVSSQKIRLAPPKNEAVLFKSFAVKDILTVEKCTINKRIIGIIVWKFKTRPPTCHILRCPDELVSKSLYEAVWGLSQVYDDITMNEVSPCDCICT